MKQIVILLICGLLLGCAATKKGFSYSQIGNAPAPVDIEPLPSNLNPIIKSASFSPSKDIEDAKAAGYVLIGRSHDDREGIGSMEVLRQAKEVGASLVVVSNLYAGVTKRDDTSVLIPQTTTHRGVVNTTLGQATFSGTSTSYERVTISSSSTKSTFSQTAYYFAKLARLSINGITVRDLTINQKLENLLNYGSYIASIDETSAAFKEGFLQEDIITHVGGIEVKSGREAYETLVSLSKTTKTITVNIIRNKKTRVKSMSF